ncbi:MAG: ABC transporter substrate-binding protein [Firmicutes bacterium]|nr:ABC transporter substrate-binding protein [Bacillota bacterium]MCL5038221.1 ABC transporter substrate-binding protein [Bacillota bacterium]
MLVHTAAAESKGEHSFSRVSRRQRRSQAQRLFFFLTLFITASLLLTSCSTGGSKPASQLTPERKVREIELYVTTADYDPVRYEFGMMVADQWRKLGLDVKVTPLAWPRLSQLGIKEKNYDAFTLNWAGLADRIDPDHFVFLTLHSSQAGVGQYNIAGYNNPEYDKIAEESRRATDPEKRRELVFKAQEIFARDLPYAPIAHRNQLMAYNKRDFDNVTTMMGEGLNAFWNFLSITPKGNKKVAVWGYPSDVTNLNVLTSTNAHDHQTARLIYDKLVQIDPEGKAIPWAAESIQQPDPKTVVVKLRKGMTFQDGKPVTSEDVRYTYQLINEVKSPYFMGRITQLGKVEAPDPQTVVFTLKEPSASFVANTLAQVYILPKHVWSKILADKGAKGVLEYQNEKPIGSGPFKLEYWRRDQEMKLTRFDKYYQPAKVEGILKIPYANVQGMTTALEAGECDIGGWSLEPGQAKKLSGLSHLAVLDIPDHGFYHINYNMRRLPFDDLAVRKALTLAIPKKAIIDQLLEGHGVIAYSFIAPINKFWHNPKVEKTDYDLEKARQVLKTAGYEWDASGKLYYPVGKSDQKK